MHTGGGSEGALDYIDCSIGVVLTGSFLSSVPPSSITSAYIHTSLHYMYKPTTSAVAIQCHIYLLAALLE